jgi:acetoin utilization protein AcuC
MPTVSETPPNAPDLVAPEAETETAIPGVATRPASHEASDSGELSVGFVWSDAMGRGLGVAGDLQPGRLLRGYRLLEALGVLQWREVRVLEPDTALSNDEALLRFHLSDYVQTVQSLSQEHTSVWIAPPYGLHEKNTRPYRGMADQAAQNVAATRAAAQVVLDGTVMRAMTLAGQQPHAQPGRAQSEDIFNDVLLALSDLRAAGQRVALVNLDAEYPAVVDEHVATDAGVLFASLHEHPAFIFPGTVAPVEQSGARERRTSVSIGLVPGAGDAEYLWACDQVIRPLVSRFEPDVLLVLAGGSAHVDEPLAHLRLTTWGYQRLIDDLCQLAPRLVLFGGGGTATGVVARLWALALATLAGRAQSLPHNLPAAYARKWGGGRLHDEPLRPLSPLMQAYVTRRTQEEVDRVQLELFPLWDLPVAVRAQTRGSRDRSPVDASLFSPPLEKQNARIEEVKRWQEIVQDLQAKADLEVGIAEPVPEQESRPRRARRSKRGGRGPSGAEPRSEHRAPEARGSRAKESGSSSQGRRRGSRKKKGGARPTGNSPAGGGRREQG